jgi:UDP-N-acetylglucosamine 4,6-dehydratase
MTGAEILITGGTGSLGKTLVKTLIKYQADIKGIRVFSRDELKQWKMKREIDSWKFTVEHLHHIPVSYIIGDVRDFERVKIAMNGATHVVHTAAMKQIPTCEDNPLEAVKTNIGGSQNIVEAAILTKSVQKVMAISTDKAVYPINLYGMTKSVMEKLMIQGNIYSVGETRRPRISCCRYGNVLGSRGSVVPLFKKQYEKSGRITVTDLMMTRFWISLPEVGRFIVERLKDMNGGEIFIPMMPSCTMIDLIELMFPDDKKPEIDFIGVRKGEKLHEALFTNEEKSLTQEMLSRFIIHNKPPLIDKDSAYIGQFSNINKRRLTKEAFKKIIQDTI